MEMKWLLATAGLVILLMFPLLPSGIAAPVGGMTGAPHGNVCAAVLAACCEVNVRAMKERDHNNPAIARYTEVARLLTGNPNATAECGCGESFTTQADLA